jgi:hypothetical protein
MSVLLESVVGGGAECLIGRKKFSAAGRRGTGRHREAFIL